VVAAAEEAFRPTVYLQHDDKDRTLDAYRDEINPAIRDRSTLSCGCARHR
jgi:hypothetical protein